MLSYNIGYAGCVRERYIVGKRSSRFCLFARVLHKLAMYANHYCYYKTESKCSFNKTFSLIFGGAIFCFQIDYKGN